MKPLYVHASDLLLIFFSFCLAHHRELKMKINKVAPNPLLSLDDVIEPRQEQRVATKPSSMSLSLSLSSRKSSNQDIEVPKKGNFL